MAYLGDVPSLLATTNVASCEVLPPGLVVATLAYLASRLVLAPHARQRLDRLLREHAAVIVQRAWRRRQQRLQAERMRVL